MPDYLKIDIFVRIWCCLQIFYVDLTLMIASRWIIMSLFGDHQITQLIFCLQSSNHTSLIREDNNFCHCCHQLWVAVSLFLSLGFILKMLSRSISLKAINITSSWWFVSVKESFSSTTLSFFASYYYIFYSYISVQFYLLHNIIFIIGIYNNFKFRYAENIFICIHNLILSL